MILKSLKNSHSYLIILFLLFSILFFIPSFFTSQFQNIENKFPFYSVLLVVISAILTFFHSIGLNNLIYDKDIIKRPNFVLAFVFLLLNTTFVTNHKMMLISFVLLFFLNFLLQLYKQKQPFSIVFNAGILLSILSFYLPNILLLFPIILISTLIFRNINWRINTISILSLFVPYFFLWSYQIFTKTELYFPVFEFNFKLFNFSIVEIALNQKIWFYVLSLVSLLSFFEIFRWMYKKSIRSRESFTIIILYFFFSVFIFLFSGKEEAVILIVTPLSVIIGNYFVYHIKIRWSEFIFFLFLFSSIFYRITMINM
jgi:hypothetical protein